MGRDRPQYGAARGGDGGGDERSQAIFAEAKALAHDLGLPVADLGPQPDREEIALLIRKSVGVARRADGAEFRQGIVDSYLRAPAEDWRTEGMSAAALADLDRTAERNAQIRKDMEAARVYARGVEDGKAAKENTQ